MKSDFKKLNKKASFITDNTFSIIAAIAVMAVVILVASPMFSYLYAKSPDEIMRTAAITACLGNIKGVGLIEFKSPRQNWAVDVGKIGKYKEDSTEIDWLEKIPVSGRVSWSKSLTTDETIKNAVGNEYPKEEAFQQLFKLQDAAKKQEAYDQISKKSSTLKIMDQQDFMNEFLAKRMYSCWTNLDVCEEGSIFSSTFAKLPKAATFCVICDSIDFSPMIKNYDDDSKGFVEANLQFPQKVSTLDDWAGLWRVPTTENTFLEFFKEKGSYRSKLYTPALEYTISSETDYFIVYSETVESLSKKIIDNDKFKAGGIGVVGVALAGGGLFAMAGGAVISTLLIDKSPDAIKNVFEKKNDEDAKTGLRSVDLVPKNRINEICSYVVNN